MSYICQKQIRPAGSRSLPIRSMAAKILNAKNRYGKHSTSPLNSTIEETLRCTKRVRPLNGPVHNIQCEDLSRHFLRSTEVRIPSILFWMGSPAVRLIPTHSPIPWIGCYFFGRALSFTFALHLKNPVPFEHKLFQTNQYVFALTFGHMRCSGPRVTSQ
jgi:hypothetical protein